MNSTNYMLKNNKSAIQIFFDLDGVLLDGSERSYQTYRDILKSYDKKFLTKETYIRLKRAKTPLSEILKKTQSEDIKATFEKEWMQQIEGPEMLKLNKCQPSTLKILKKLKKRYSLHLITLRRNKKNLILELKRTKLFTFFESIIADNTGERNKAKLLLNTAKPGDIIIGDSESEIRAGKELHLITISVETGFRNRELLKKENPYRIIRKLSRIDVVLARYEKK